MRDKDVIIINLSRQRILADRAQLASTFWTRLVGLLDRSRLEPGEGLILQPCSAVHTFRMSFSIDVAFVGKDGEIVLLVEEMAPNRIFWGTRRAVAAIELPGGTFRATGTRLGDKVTWA